MKIKLHHIIMILSLTLSGPLGIGFSYAQEAGAPNFDAFEEDPHHEKENIISSPGESATDPIISKSSNNHVVTKDSVSFKALPTNKSVKSASPSLKPADKTEVNDDSILSFNFLYYIIQKYKMQDIID